jgi:antitoxin component HigA of HigAB toxin-antitoxin module
MNLTGQTMTAEAGRARGAWAANVPPRPARSPREHKAMLDELMRLGRKMDAGTATRAEADAVQVLTLLTGEYETARYGEIKDRSTPVDRLRFLLDENDMSASDLGRLLGDRPLGTRILNGERALSKAHVRRLAAHFKLSPAYFL